MEKEIFYIENDDDFAKFWKIVLKLPEDKFETLCNENVCIADKISLFNCSIWPKMRFVNESGAVKNRIRGNELYNSRRYDEAIFKYNLSLCQSSSIETRGLAYANRAAAYLGLALYQDCLDSVRLAKECPLPANVLEDVAVSERMAIDRLEPETLNDNEPIELSYRLHKRISSFVYCLSLRNPHNPDDGIITNKNLLPGDILIVEPVVLMHGSINECTNCLRKGGSLQPCKCSYMFCSLECKTEAFATYHSYECPLVEFLSLYDVDERLVLRVFFKLIQRFENVQSLRNYLENNKSLPNPFERDFEDLSNGGGSFESLIRMFLIKKQMTSITPGITYHHVYAQTAIVIDVLKNANNILLSVKTSEEWSFLSELLIRLFYILFNLNPYFRNQIRYVHNSNREVDLEGGALANHSFAWFIRRAPQDPNVLTYYVKNVLIVRAMKTISSGTELMY